MIIKELKIKNFRSYYGESIFNFKDGLTLIIGGNGDGKTTFFDALDWLFATDKENKSIDLISEKRKSEISLGESDFVSVSIVFEHEGEKILEKRFKFENVNNNKIITSDFYFQGYDGVGAEREMINGSLLLERCFDTVIRKYCLFKGESNLNVFNNETALKTLVDKFSNIRQFNEYVDILSSFEKKSDSAYKKELNTDNKVSKKAKDLEHQQKNLNKKIFDIKKDIDRQKEETKKYECKLEELEKYQETSEKYNSIKNRIATLKDKARKEKSRINEEYNIRLLDELWVLIDFPNVFEEFKAKVSTLKNVKIKLDKEYIEQCAKEKGKQEAIQEFTAIANGATPLPWYMPDDTTMQEMVDEHICKVCNRVAEEGSDAHNFMKEKLAQYLKSTQTKKTKSEDKPLFINSNIENLHNLSLSLGGIQSKEISNLRCEIEDEVAFNESRKERLLKLEGQIKEAEEEKCRLLIQNDGVSEEILEANFSDISGYFKEKNKAQNKYNQLEQELDVLLKEKRSIDRAYEELNPSNGTVKLYAKVHTAFSKILKSFTNAKKKNLCEFLSNLEKKSNEYLELLNIDDFHGVIRIIETTNESAKIQLCSSNGSNIKNPNGALETTMYMSVLFAISDITTLKREIDYPLIFDAPTSSFESFKESEFYNVIDKIDKQCIIVTKDLLDKDEETGNRKLNEDKINELTCSVYRIEKQRPFDPNDLSTICTTSKLIK